MPTRRSRIAAVVLAAAVAAAVPAGAAPPTEPTGKVPRIQGALVALARAAEQARSGERVTVYVVDGGDAAGAVERLGGTVLASTGDTLTVEVPAARLLALAGDPGVGHVFAPEAPFPEGVGPSEGVAFHDADDWHAAGFDGSGIDVLVVDSGFIGYDDGQISPISGTEVGASCTGGLEAVTAHGTAVAEVVRDMAPGADIHLFRTCLTSDGPQIVGYVADHGIEVVTQSLGFFNTGPLDGSDPYGVFSHIDGAVAAGAVWFNSVGNYRRGHWGGPWDDNGSGIHDFGTTDYIEMYLEAGDGLYLRWDDWNDGDGSAVDLDMYLTDTAGDDIPAVWAKSIDEQSVANPAPPIEKIVVQTTGTYRIEVRYFPSDPVPEGMEIDLFSPQQDMPSGYRVSSRSLNDPSTLESVLAVGAVWHGDGLQEPWSSEGPTADARVKPDLGAADGVMSETYGSFWGTSAAAPHAAGAAAVVLQATGAPPDELRDLLGGLLYDAGPAGPDNRYGHGIIDLGSPPAGTCKGMPATVIALPGQREIHGTSGPDVIVGNNAKNKIWGKKGDDIICAGKKADVIRPGAGDDEVYGQGGSDRVIYGSGEDELAGNGSKKDKLDFKSMAVPVVLDLGSGTGTVGGTPITVSGFERVFGGSAGDQIEGSSADEVLKGYGGADELLGRGGDDTLQGGKGDDVLDGNGGPDEIDGGKGDDDCFRADSIQNCEN